MPPLVAGIWTFYRGRGFVEAIIVALVVALILFVVCAVGDSFGARSGLVRSFRQVLGIEGSADPAKLQICQRAHSFWSYGSTEQGSTGYAYPRRICLYNCGPTVAKEVRVRVVNITQVDRLGEPLPLALKRSGSDSDSIHIGEEAYYDVATIIEPHRYTELTCRLAWDCEVSEVTWGSEEREALEKGRGYPEIHYVVTGENLSEPLSGKFRVWA